MLYYDRRSCTCCWSSRGVFRSFNVGLQAVIYSCFFLNNTSVTYLVPSFRRPRLGEDVGIAQTTTQCRKRVCIPQGPASQAHEVDSEPQTVDEVQDARCTESRKCTKISRRWQTVWIRENDTAKRICSGPNLVRCRENRTTLGLSSVFHSIVSPAACGRMAASPHCIAS